MLEMEGVFFWGGGQGSVPWSRGKLWGGGASARQEERASKEVRCPKGHVMRQDRGFPPGCELGANSRCPEDGSFFGDGALKTSPEMFPFFICVCFFGVPLFSTNRQNISFFAGVLKSAKNEEGSNLLGREEGNCHQGGVSRRGFLGPTKNWLADSQEMRTE